MIRTTTKSACGTSWHAALVGEYQIESLARMPVEVEYASELRYRNPPLDGHPLVFAITQSGETADTLAALKHAKSLGMRRTLAVCNVASSAMVLMQCREGQVTASRNIALVQGPTSSWLITPAEPESAGFVVVAASTALLASLLRRWMLELAPPAPRVLG